MMIFRDPSMASLRTPPCDPTPKYGGSWPPTILVLTPMLVEGVGMVSNWTIMSRFSTVYRHLAAIKHTSLTSKLINESIEIIKRRVFNIALVESILRVFCRTITFSMIVKRHLAAIEQLTRELVNLLNMKFYLGKRRLCDPSDQNESHVENFRIWVLYIVLNTASLALKWHQKLCSTYLFDKVMNDYVFTLLKLLILEKYIESLSVCLMV